MAHYRLTVDQVKQLKGQDLEAMEFAFLVYERRQAETLTDLVGSQLGTLWSIDSLMGQAPKEEDRFTWSLREQPRKLSTPLTTVIASGAGIKFMDQLKKMASKSQLRTRHDPSIYKLPKKGFLDGCEVVDLSKVSKDQFLKFAGKIS